MINKLLSSVLAIGLCAPVYASDWQSSVETNPVYQTTTVWSYIEVVLVFRPVYSLFKVDHGFKSGCHTRWFGFVVIGFARGQDAMGRMGPFSIVVGQPLAYPQPRF